VPASQVRRKPRWSAPSPLVRGWAAKRTDGGGRCHRTCTRGLIPAAVSFDPFPDVRADPRIKSGDVHDELLLRINSLSSSPSPGLTRGLTRRSRPHADRSVIAAVGTSNFSAAAGVSSPAARPGPAPRGTAGHAARGLGARAASVPARNSASSATSLSRKPRIAASSAPATLFRAPSAAIAARIPSSVIVKRSVGEGAVCVILDNPI
jgi:hypothetical protein